MDMQAHRDIGRLQGEVTELQKQVASMTTKLDAIHTTITSTKGGWKMLSGIIGMTVLLTTFLNNIGKIAEWLIK